MSHTTIEQKRASHANGVSGSGGALHTRNLKQLKESQNRGAASKGDQQQLSHVSRQSATSALSRASKQRKSLSKSTNHRQAAKMTANRNGKKKNYLDDVSVITAERLSRFNQARGTVAGTKTDEIAKGGS